MYSIGDYLLKTRLKSVSNFISVKPFNNPQIILLLLLRGTFNIKKYSIDKSIPQYIDYTILGQSDYNHNITREFIKYISSIRNTSFLYKNIDFYKPILLEFITCLFSYSAGHGIVTFVHLYRVLERISYALPLLYAKNSNDYKGTYEHFKSFFENKDQKTGELKFFKASLLSILDETEKRFVFTYEFDEIEEKALSVCLKDFNIADKIVSNDKYIAFDLSLIDTISLLINVRNSFFHALSGKDHITLEHLIYPDKTFMKITPYFMNALGFIISKTIEHIIYPIEI